MCVFSFLDIANDFIIAFETEQNFRAPKCEIFLILWEKNNVPVPSQFDLKNQVAP